MTPKEFTELNDIFSSNKTPTLNPAQKTKMANIAYVNQSDNEDFEEELTKAYCQWTSHNGKVFVPASKTKTRLIPGVYEIGNNPTIGLFFEKIPVKTEGLIQFPDTNSHKVVDEIVKFWESEEIFTKYDLAYKRGIILWGPAGSGKSSTCQLIMADVVKRGGIVVKFDEPYVFIDGMRILRTIQPDTPVVVMMEDIDSIIETYQESEVLNILDGVNEIRKTVFLATTNYPDRLGARIINRPSRFDKRFKIDFPSAASRKLYLEYVIGNGDAKKGRKEAKRLQINLKQWVQDTHQMTIAHLKELFIATVILGDSYEDAIATLKSMKESVDNKENDQFGFEVCTNSKNAQIECEEILDWD